ncbi:hypothetical protein [Streptomyces sp. NBC_00859]|uniref:MmyB family transcriptional regulator n=1 Tax=Streptomyces sp. NBC_00859 TaxID=2903682 RepID=UPI0038705569
MCWTRRGAVRACSRSRPGRRAHGTWWAFLLYQHCDILGWNRAEAGLLTDFSELPRTRRNMLWMMFGWALPGNC